VLRLLGVLGVLVVASPASAEPDARPWAAGVSDADQTRALELLARGNEQLDQGLYSAALDLYRQGIAIWDHPAIRYNVAVADINLERPIEAYQELERALAFPEALEPDVRDQAHAYERLLHAQIVHLSIDCVDAGTRITLDGVEIATPCPGSSSRLLLPGRHQLVATKSGYLTRAVELVPSGGDTPHERIDLMTIEEATVTRRRWPLWKPYAVVGTAAAIGVAGLVVELQSAATFRSYDHAIAQLCPDRPCDSVPSVVSSAYSEARRENHVAIGLFIGAGATLATGAVLLWIDRAMSERLGYNVPLPVATAGRDGSSVAIRMTF
jgi:hypothetical protein